MSLDQIDVDDYYYDDMSKKLIKNGKKADDEEEMSFLDHLEELRWHIIRAIIVVFSVGIVLFLMKNFVFDTVIFGPRNEDFLSYQFICNFSNWIGLGDGMCFTPKSFDVQTTDLGELFFAHIKVSFIGGFIVAFPYVFWEFWRFISPGLHIHERKAARGIIFICSFLFFLGVLFGYFVISPFAINFLAGYNINGVVAEPTLSSMVNYMIMFTAPAGMIFELPVIVYFLSRAGLVTPDIMKQYRRHSIIIILALAALITPPDVITQFLIGIPLYILYEISITISARVVNRLEKEDKERYGDA